MEETKEVLTEEEITFEVENKKPTRKEKKQLKKQKNIEKMLSYGNGSDVSRCGLFGIRGMRILAWTFLNCNAIALLFSTFGLVSMIDTDVAKIFSYLFAIIGELAIPCFLIAKFAVVMKKQETIFKTIRNYLIIAFGIEILFIFVLYAYAYVILRALSPGLTFETGGEAYLIITTFIGKHLSFNIFIDMAMMSLIMFFINYHRDNWSNKKTRLFKCLALLPILYMCAGITLKTLQVLGKIQMPLAVLPLLPTSTITGFLAMVTIFFFINVFRHKYFRKGGTKEQFANFKKSKADSKEFSKIGCFVLIAYGALDFIILTVLTALGRSNPFFTQIGEALELGNSILFIVFAPVLFMFNYKADFNNDKVDLLVPLSGIGMIVFIYFNIIFFIVVHFLKLFTG